jgi:hypothetical protein
VGEETRVSASLDDLLDELARGRIFECSLRDPNWHLDGLQLGENIYIDPRPAVLETVIHELLHRRFQRWGERKVTRTARKLVAGMTESQKAHWWRAYAKVKRKGRPVSTDE